MTTTREQAVSALFTRLSNAAAWGAATRRLASPETVASPGQPALFELVHKETHRKPSPSLPTIRTINAEVIVYIDTGIDPNAIPDSVLNPLKDAIEAALVPDDPSTNRCTLGGLVFSCQVGSPVGREADQAPGDKLGKGLVVFPVDICIP